MKVKIPILFFLISLMSLTEVVSQTFNTSTDLLLANFDLKPDEDDVMAAAALGCMLKHPDLEGVEYYAVAGAYGTQDKHTYITAATPDFFTVLFGAEKKKWTDAHTDWDASVKRVQVRVRKILKSGGKVFVMEAGQSDFLYDVLQAVMAKGVSLSTINNNVIVVQHSKWNEKNTEPLKLEWVKSHTVYHKIEDGNTGDNATPGYRTDEPQWLAQAISPENLNANARTIWIMADQVCKEWQSSWTNKWIAAGGLDFSDAVESWYIFNIGSKANSLPTFWSRYVFHSGEEH